MSARPSTEITASHIRCAEHDMLADDSAYEDWREAALCADIKAKASDEVKFDAEATSTKALFRATRLVDFHGSGFILACQEELNRRYLAAVQDQVMRLAGEYASDDHE